MRIDKLLAHSGYGTRKEVKQLISQGWVEVNGERIYKIGQVVDENKDQISVFGDLINYEKFSYFVMNKPSGIICSTEDGRHQTVIDWMGPEYEYLGLFPVGRLDIDTTGLLLLTNNGQLSHRLLSPKHHVAKTYQAVVQGSISESQREKFISGLDLGDFVTLPAQLELVAYDESNDQSTVKVTIQEGKFHQIKRMFENIGSKVYLLHRLSMGPLVIDDSLKTGEFRPLNEDERQLLVDYGLE